MWGDSSIGGAPRPTEEAICAEWEERLHLLVKVGGGHNSPSADLSQADRGSTGAMQGPGHMISSLSEEAGARNGV